MVFIINKANYLLLKHVFLVQYIDQQSHLLHLFLALPSLGSGLEIFGFKEREGGEGGPDKKREDGSGH